MAPHAKTSSRSTPLPSSSRPRSPRPSARALHLALVLATFGACAPSGVAPFRPPTLETPRCERCACDPPDASADAPERDLPDAPAPGDDVAVPRPTEPFTLEASSPRVEVHAGEEVWLTARLARSPEHVSFVTLSAAGLPPHVIARAAIGREPGEIAFVITAEDLARPVTDWPFTIEARADGTSSTRRVLLTILPERATPEE